MAKKSEAKEVAIYLDFENLHPFEGSYLFEKFIREEKGLTFKAVSTTRQNIFGQSVEEEPITKDLEVAPGIFSTFRWGSFIIENIEGELEMGYTIKDEILSFRLQGKIDARQNNLMQALAEEFKLYVAANSIYKGRAIQLGDFVTETTPPTFIDTEKIKLGEYILNESVEAEVSSSVLTLIKNYEACKKYNVPVKRGVLLTGPYGTGKTLVARQTARLCVDNGWTFILVKDPKHFAKAFAYAKRFSPSVVFVEDIDAAFTSNHRDSKTNDFLNTFDNIYSKGSETMFIMTSNHPEQLSKPMLRPGRIDCVIQFELPNTKSIERLLNYFAADFYYGKTEATSTYLASKNITPAVLRELVERAKLRAIEATGSARFYVGDLINIYDSMKTHLQLIEQAIDLGVKKQSPTLEEKVDRMYDTLKRIM